MHLVFSVNGHKRLFVNTVVAGICAGKDMDRQIISLFVAKMKSNLGHNVRL